MPWICPECNNPENHEQAVRCACGYELVDDTPADYSKLGGALYLVAAGFLINILISAINLSSWLSTGPGLTDIYIQLQIIFYATSLLISCLLLFFLFKHSRAFPVLAIIFIAVNVFFTIGIYLYIKASPDLPNYVVLVNRAIDAAVITTIAGTAWIAYFLRSERVRKTFIN